jgi:23S rRNA (adenine-N6)-dimethyltransferase
VAGYPGRWGWHELDSRWAGKLVDAVAVGPGDLVLDVGAGTGALTDRLVALGARVVAIELHPGRAAALRARYRAADVTVVQADAADLWLPRRPFKVVANPPFAITTALLRRLTGPASHLQQASLVLPAWAVRRWAAGRGDGGTPSRPRFSFAAGPSLPAGAFRPPPPGPVRMLCIVTTGPAVAP